MGSSGRGARRKNRGRADAATSAICCARLSPARDTPLTANTSRPTSALTGNRHSLIAAAADDDDSNGKGDLDSSPTSTADVVVVECGTEEALAEVNEQSCHVCLHTVTAPLDLAVAVETGREDEDVVVNIVDGVTAAAAA